MALTHAQKHAPDPIGPISYGYDIGLLRGKTLIEAVGERFDESLRMVGEDGTRYMLGNAQERDDGFERGDAYIEDIAGDLADLVGSPITQAEEVSDLSKHGDGGWTFYRLSTAKGHVVLRFCDNEYDAFYSRWVDFMVYPPSPKN